MSKTCLCQYLWEVTGSATLSTSLELLNDVFEAAWHLLSEWSR